MRKKIIVISSGKGGVGKTTTAINLGAAINHFGKNVLIIDGNLSTPNIGIHLNSLEVPVCLNHILSEKAEVHEAVYEHASGIKIIPSSLSIKELKKLKPEKMKTLKKDFKALGDYILIDSAAGLGKEAISAMETADELIVVTNPEMPAITDALKTIKLAEEKKIPIKGIIITKVKKNKSEMQPEVVKDMLESPILGSVPEDSCAQEALSLKDALVHTHPKSNSARAYKEIAARLIDVDYNSNKDRPSVWVRMFKRKGY